jgi:L,D-transpeptidase YbiS
MENQELENNENLIEGTEPASIEVQAVKEHKSFSNTWFGKTFWSLFFLFFVFSSVFIFPPFLQKAAVSISIFAQRLFFTNSDAEMAGDKEIIESSISKLEKQLDAYTPSSFYMIINSTDNEFSLMKGKEEIRHGKCSTGSYVVLEDHKQRKFLFKTPKGLRKVIGKKTDPVWTKPNWAFIEEGLPVPSATHPSRFEEGVLGDYALTLGDGYMIHGTIWQRYLGLPVTHGCVRLNDADLEAVFKALSKGSHIYIY